MNKYDEQAQKFLEKTGTEFKAEFLRYGPHFEGEANKRDIYKITLKRGRREFTFNFGQSVYCSGRWVALQDSIYHAKRGDRSNKLHVPPGGHTTWKRNEKFEEPSAYNVLACMTKYDPGTLENFCSEFGYDADSKKAEKIYLAVIDEYKNLTMLFNEEELQEMAEIQ